MNIFTPERFDSKSNFMKDIYGDNAASKVQMQKYIGGLLNFSMVDILLKANTIQDVLLTHMY